MSDNESRAVNQESSAKTIRNFTDLIARQESHAIVMLMHKLTKTFPKEEAFGLTN